MPQSCWQQICDVAPFTIKTYTTMIGKAAEKKTGLPRKKRNARFFDPQYAHFLRLNKLLGSRTASILVPQLISQQQQYILDAITTRLPIRARTMICGFPIFTVLVGVIYRHGKLVWLLRNLENRQLCLSSHFYADVRHLLENLRHKFPHQQKRFKYNRQSFNNATCYLAKDKWRERWISLNTFGKSVNEFSPSDYDLTQTQKFLTMTDHANNFFKNTDPSTQGLLTYQIVTMIKGWKSFERTVPLSGKCTGGKRTACTCSYNMGLIMEDWHNGNMKDMVKSVVSHTYTSIVNEQVHDIFDAYNKTLS
jgi:hypothetical protein